MYLLFIPILLLLLPIFYVIIVFMIDRKLANNIDEKTLKQWHNDPANWKSGVIYHNPADPRLLPPKRTKEMGWTINMGNRWSITAVALLFALMLLIIVVMIITERGA